MKVFIPPEAAGQRLSDYLHRNGYPLFMPCGGKGTCGKCRVTVEGGGEVPACRTVCPPQGITVFLREESGTGLTMPYETKMSLPARRGLALDIGTTTLALAAVDLDSGVVFDTRSVLNPQSRFGADVLTRIEQSRDHLRELQTVLLDAAGQLAAPFLPAERMTVVGNPTMLSLFCGVSPEPMGHAPFTPAFTDAGTLPGSNFGLAVDTVDILPGISAFFGADAVAGVRQTGLTGSTVPALFLDIGTNGEMALYDPARDRLTVTSTAAGPAFEGATVSCGMGGVRGAVCKVWVQNGVFYYRTVEDAPAVGICGSGLIDLVACLLDLQILDETGLLESDPFVLTGCHVTNGTPAAPERVLTLTGRDIREVQLAKSALRAGMESLLTEAGISPETVGRVVLAGGMGNYLNGISAVRIGLLPPQMLPRLTVAGNAALAGAAEALKTDAFSRPIAAETVDLNSLPYFSERFVDEMLFPAGEDF